MFQYFLSLFYENYFMFTLYSVVSNSCTLFFEGNSVMKETAIKRKKIKKKIIKDGYDI